MVVHLYRRRKLFLKPTSSRVCGIEVRAPASVPAYISCLSTTIFSCDMSSMEAGIPPTP